MRFSHLGAALLVLTSVAISQSVAHPPASNGKPETGWSSLRPDARRAILRALEEDDPGWIQQAELAASDGDAGDGFGYSVAASGNTVVVGAPVHPYSPPNQGPGAAYVFVESGGTWSQQAELTASDGAGGDQFGDSVSLDGNTVVVGAPLHAVGPNQGLGQGAAYVFVKSGETWIQQAELIASDGASWDFFGISVGVSGSTAVVGAVYHKASGLNEPGPGAAYVFAEDGGTWSQQAELTASDGFSYDLFGISVAVSGSTGVVGAPRHTVGMNVNQGAAYAFAASGGTWMQQAELTESEDTEYDYFGASVAISGSTALVGAPLQDAAYVFGEIGTIWSEQAKLTASGGTLDNEFGDSVAIHSGTLVVGANNQDVGSNLGRGAAYVFVESGGTWIQQAELTASDGANLDNFGVSVAVSGSTALVGAPGHEVGSNRAQGVAYIFGAPVVMLSPISLSFGNEAIDTTSAAKTVTLTNTGTATLDITSIAIMLGPNFAISSNTCGATLAAGKTCKVKVTFTPSAIGSATGTLTFTDNASGSPQTVSLTGTGEAQATLTPSSYTFAKTKVGDTSAAHKFTLKNNLSTTLTGISYSVTSRFAVSASTCGTTLDSKTACTISVTFTPSSEETFTGTLTVTDGANDSPQTSSLTGTGD
ncbi:MAG: choice-of-anchor D domain-containing protein [Candidatus Sulfotelmatobacter sp.]